MWCHSFNRDYELDEGGTCKECCKQVNKLKQEIQELKSKVAFFNLLSPIDSKGPPTEVVLVASDDVSNAPPIPIMAQKDVLMSRSPVFKAMLENDMEESESGTIKIGDVSHNALSFFVKCLSIEASFDEQMTYSLLALAEKYQVKHLKTYCEIFLIERLNCDTAIMDYVFAHQHNAKKLLDAALTIIIDNMEKFKTSEDFVELKKSNIYLVIEIYEAYLAKITSMQQHIE